MSSSDRTNPRRGAFFGRRKGHPLRPRQAALFDTLLPRLAIDLCRPCTARALAAVSHPGREHPPRDRFRRRRAHDRTSRAAPADRLHRGRAVRQRHGQGAGGLGRARRSRNVRLHHGDATEVVAWLPPASLARRRSPLSRSLAEAAALEATLRAGPEHRRHRAHPAAGRRVSFRNRHPGLCGMDAQTPAAITRFRVDGRARRRLAAGVARLFRHPLRSQGQTRRPRAVLSGFSADG